MKDLSELDHLDWNQDDVYDFDGDHVVIKEGYAALSSRVAATLDIRLNTEVKMIRLDDAQANVEVVIRSEGKATSLRAGYVVVTLPLGVLKSRLVRCSGRGNSVPLNISFHRLRARASPYTERIFEDA